MSPSNWEPVAQACSDYDQHIWQHNHNLVARVASYNLAINLAPPPTSEEVAGLAHANTNTQHMDILNKDGFCKLPPFLHHVDGNLYADIRVGLTSEKCSILVNHLAPWCTQSHF